MVAVKFETDEDLIEMRKMFSEVSYFVVCLLQYRNSLKCSLKDLKNTLRVIGKKLEKYSKQWKNINKWLIIQHGICYKFSKNQVIKLLLIGKVTGYLPKSESTNIIIRLYLLT